jgi:hypothetical protein
MISLKDMLVDNAIDSFEDVLSDEMYQFINKKFDPMLTDLEKKEDNIVNKFIENYMQNLKFIMAMWAITQVMDILERKGAILASQWAYSNRNKFKKYVDKLPNVVRKGPVGKMIAGMLGADGQKDMMWIQNTTMHIQDIERKISEDEKQGLEVIKDKRDLKMKNIEVYKNRKDKEMALFYDLSTRGAWESNSKEHKKLYRSVTGYKESWNKHSVDKINSFSEYIKTVEGDILSLTKSNFQLLQAMHLYKKGNK